MMSWFRNKIKVTGEWMDWWDVVEIIRPYNDKANPASDTRILLPDEKSIRQLLNGSRAKKFAYKGEKFDCDDFVRVFFGWMSEEGFGRVFSPYIDLTFPDWAEGHRTVCFIVDGEIKIGEVQTGQFPVYEDATINWIGWI